MRDQLHRFQEVLTSISGLIFFGTLHVTSTIDRDILLTKQLSKIIAKAFNHPPNSKDSHKALLHVRQVCQRFDDFVVRLPILSFYENLSIKETRRKFPFWRSPKSVV
jgi:hypothetical protein